MNSNAASGNGNLSPGETGTEYPVLGTQYAPGCNYSFPMSDL